jgi:hypothetical protein
MRFAISRVVSSLILGAFVASGCAPKLRYVPSISVTTGVDFSPYLKSGFLFTPEAPSGQYDAIGLVSFATYSEGKVVHDGRAADGGLTARIDFMPVSSQEALKKAYEAATAMGADALTRFTLRTVFRRSGDVDVPGIEISGFAIRRTSAK